MTPREHALLTFLRSYRDEKGYFPSLIEMSGHLGLKGKATVHRMLCSLEWQGIIQRQPNKARSIILLDELPAMGQFTDMELLEELERRGAIALSAA